MTPLYKHQQEIIDADSLKCGIFQGTGSGKTRTALELAEGLTLVICPKQQKLDRTWQNNLLKMGRISEVLPDVVSKEEFKKVAHQLPRYETVIVDECHTMCGVTPDTVQRKGISKPKTSQLFESLRLYLKTYPPKRLYLLSATPASKPMHVWALGTLLGKDWDYFRFREMFYFQKKIGYKTIWLPNNSPTLKQRLADNVKKLGFTGTLFDYFDVPEQTHLTKYFELTKEQKDAIKKLKAEEADPMAIRSRQRTIENGCLYGTTVIEAGDGIDLIQKSEKVFENEKINYILERAAEFPKILIFAAYTAQVYDIVQKLTEIGYNALPLTGQSKDRQNLITTAELCSQCIVVAQSSISSGYELKSFPVVIFASKSYRYLDYEQGLGRVLRADALKKNLYINLVVRDGMDEECHKAIMQGKDFQERVME